MEGIIILEFYFFLLCFPQNIQIVHCTTLLEKNPQQRGFISFQSLIQYEVFIDMLQGVCAENTAKKYNISREEQDEYAVRSYKLSQQAADSGRLKKEIIPVEIKKKKGTYHKRYK